MAQDDIYRMTINYEGPTMASSCSLYFQEDGLSTAVVGPTRSLNASWNFQKLDAFLQVLNNQWHLVSQFCARVDGLAVPPDLVTIPPTVGGRIGDPLPADNCLLMQLLQSVHPRTSNGRLYLPGLSENDADVGVVENAFLNNQVTTLGNAISSAVNEVGGTGSWVPGVISAKVRDATPGQKDWQGAFSQLIAALGNPVIARQVRRRTKVKGGAT